MVVAASYGFAGLAAIVFCDESVLINQNAGCERILDGPAIGYCDLEAECGARALQTALLL